MPRYLGDLHYDERGAGEPVVVIGGGPARDPDYLGDLGALGDSFRLIVPHLRGSGLTPFPADVSSASWWAQADDIEALRLHLGLPRITVLGHSAGTRTALAFAVRFPDSLGRLALVTPPTSALVDVESDVPSIRQRRAGEPAYDAALELAGQGAPADPTDLQLTTWQQRIAPLSYARWESPQRAHAVLGGWRADAVAAFAASDAPHTFRADVAATIVPVRVIAGADDGIVGSTGPLALASAFADGRAALVAGAGHYPWIDRPDDFRVAAEDALLR